MKLGKNGQVIMLPQRKREEWYRTPACENIPGEGTGESTRCVSRRGKRKREKKGKAERKRERGRARERK